MNITSWTQRIERLACSSFVVYKLSQLYYKTMVKREARLAKITADDNVLVIGGGPCPHSGILIHQFTGANVTIIDNQQDCVQCSQELVRRLGISSKVKILLSDALDMDLNGFSVIHVALQIQPKSKVLDVIRAKSNPKTKLLVRMPKKSVSGLYCSVSQEGLKGLIKAKHGLFGNVGSTIMDITKGETYEQKVA